MSRVWGSTSGRLGSIRNLLAIAGLLSVVTACGGPAGTASPSAGGAGDPRSSGQGPGLVGDPLFAIGAVVGIGLAAVLLTLIYMRMTSREDR